MAFSYKSFINSGAKPKAKSGSWSVSSKKRVSRIAKTKKALKRKSYKRK